MKLAPVVISTYGRVDKLKLTLEALENNTLARDTEVFVYSDGPAYGDENRVKEVRDFLLDYQPNFSLFKVVLRDRNFGIFQNRMALKERLELSNRVIFLEEDNITAPGFLTFLNNGLETYEYDLRVISISGYTKAYDYLESYSKDYYGVKRFSSWGYGCWKRSFDPYMRPEHYLSLWKLKKKLSLVGEDIYYMARKVRANRLDALDVRVMLYQNFTNQYTLYPRKSLVDNIGHDGTGLHCRDSNRFNIDSLWDKINFDFDFAINDEPGLLQDIQKFRRIGLLSKIKSLVCYSYWFRVISKLVRS